MCVWLYFFLLTIIKITTRNNRNNNNSSSGMLYINEANHQPMPSTHFTSVNTYIIHRNTSHDLNTGFQNQEPIRCQTINQSSNYNTHYSKYTTS